VLLVCLVFSKVLMSLLLVKSVKRVTIVLEEIKPQFLVQLVTIAQKEQLTTKMIVREWIKLSDTVHRVNVLML